MDSSTITWIGILAIFLAILITLFVYAVHCGLLCDIVVGTGKPAVKSLIIAYKFARGPYKDCGSIFTEACSLAPSLRTVGIYYDDPRKVAAAKLRSAVGCILAEDKEIPDQQLVKTFTDHEFKLFNVPAAQKVFYTNFPFKGVLSVIIAVQRVYTSLSYYAEERGLLASPWFEIYTRDTIYFMAVLDKNDEGGFLQEFLVPEAIQASLDDKKEEEEAKRQAEEIEETS